MNKRYSLGIDTSNYKTSVALVDNNGNIVSDCRRFLAVKEGQRGLRQSEALFQHVNNLPELVEKVIDAAGGGKNIDIVSVSSKPRPVEGSYMPVFNAGVSFGKVAAKVAGAHYAEFSHQEGHVEAVKFFSELKDEDDIVAFHFSGGTTEAVYIGDGSFDICAGSRDIAYGQLIDRVGVKLGMAFPAGEEMDRLATAVLSEKGFRHKCEVVLPKIKCSEGFVNLSGIETAAMRLIEENVNTQELIFFLFKRISQSIIDMIRDTSEKTGCMNFLFAGGVSSSEFVREYIASENLKQRIVFGKGELSQDNAVGIALLGGEKVWR